MALEPGICPKCHDYLLLKSDLPFLVCPMCGESISSETAIKDLQKKCKDKDCTSGVLADCVALEMAYGPELPFAILSQIVKNFPLLESPSYLLVKLTGYELAAVRAYLETFASRKSDPENVPWAEEFLDICLEYRNMEMADLFSAYVENKIAPDKREKYREKIRQLRKEYTFRASDPKSTKTLMALYIGASVVNVLLLPFFMVLSGWLSPFWNIYYVVNIAIALVVVCGEMLLLFWHNKCFGNRLGMDDRERLWMVIFMSSLVIALGASILGSFWIIRL